MTPGRRLGQHFLTDPELLRRIAAALDPSPADVVIEIGPGRGSLTAQLAPRVARVIAIEKDRKLARDCGVRSADCGLDNVEVVEGDALKVDWQALIPQSAIRNAQFKIVGNIPYSSEVAERIAAAPGGKAYGALSVGVQAACQVELLFRVRAGAFRPPPRVESALLRLTPLAEPLIRPEDGPALRRFVTACFSRRRKQLRNVLAAAAGRPAEAASAGLAALGLDPAARPETLPPAAFVRLLRWSGRL
ncbi:MAG: hypothetical protein AUH42_06930 [Gemmatimonadetes bacterium 13_1_40CM_70_11]|nr:MAG: hypothetical protein AUH42_06930 [Gemmatimonadetes bacterium 13_1_40CM_70_11]